MVDPIAVASAANTTAISAMRRNASGTARTLAGPDPARRPELERAAFAGALKHRTEAEPEHAQVHERAAERCYDLDARAQVFLHFAQPESKDHGHPLISSTRGRPGASGPRPWRSRP